MKSIFLELIPIEVGLEKLLAEVKKSYQIVPDMTIIHRIQNDSVRNIADGQEYRLFDNAYWQINGKIDDEDPGSVWIEIFKK